MQFRPTVRLLCHALLWTGSFSSGGVSVVAGLGDETKGNVKSVASLEPRDLFPEAHSGSDADPDFKMGDMINGIGFGGSILPFLDGEDALGCVGLVLTVVLAPLCVFHVLPACKRVCVDPRGRWHAHKKHCQESVGCYDKNHLWHRQHKHCRDNKVCQDHNGYWHKRWKRCFGDSCVDKNNEWQRHQKNCDKLICKDIHGRWRAHWKHCKTKRMIRSDLALPDTLNIDNSFISITNAANFTTPDLEVLRGMIILPEDAEDDNYASFEHGADWAVDGTTSKHEYFPGVWAGSFTFPHPTTEAPVLGQWLWADPKSADERAHRVLAQIDVARKAAVNGLVHPEALEQQEQVGG